MRIFEPRILVKVKSFLNAHPHLHQPITIISSSHSFCTSTHQVSLPLINENLRAFGSDNQAPVHPRIMSAMMRVNRGHVESYGMDIFSDQARELMKNIFGKDTESHFVFNGTAANVLSLSEFLKPHHAVLASEHAHLINDECGAPERAWGGAKIISIPSKDAKLRIEDLRPHIIRKGDQHYSQVKAISITQPTELGTLYTPEEIKRLSEFAHSHNMILHMDGARLVNAAASLNCSLRALTTDCGVDVLSLGGTKNGLLFGEAVVFLTDRSRGSDTVPSSLSVRSPDFKFSRKQLLQLPSKTRYLAAQFLEFLGTGLWLENARHANSMATALSKGLAKSKFAQLTQQTEVNSCFVTLPKKVVPRLKRHAFFYVWNEETYECRLMTSWDTTLEDVNGFLSALEEVGEETKPDCKISY